MGLRQFITMTASFLVEQYKSYSRGDCMVQNVVKF